LEEKIQERAAGICKQIFIFALIEFGLKDMMPDILSGVSIRSSGFVKRGERVELGGFRGEAERLGLRQKQA